eukprot:9733538-Ditylum_brightwellii.AAC.1
MGSFAPVEMHQWQQPQMGPSNSQILNAKVQSYKSPRITLANPPMHQIISTYQAHVPAALHTPPLHTPPQQHNTPSTNHNTPSTNCSFFSNSLAQKALQQVTSYQDAILCAI